MIFMVNANSLRQRGRFSGPNVSSYADHIGSSTAHPGSWLALMLTPGKVKCNLVPLVGADINSLGQECCGV